MKNLMTYLILLISATGFAQANSTDTLKYCVNKNKVGIGGHDAVHYHISNKAVAGKPYITATVEGIEYRFASEDNKKKFINDPQKYLPQFGGWCSMTLAMGRATTPTYDNFAILGGKLYLFERTISMNGRELWLKDPKSNEAIATTNYEAYRTTGRIK